MLLFFVLHNANMVREENSPD